MISACLFPGAFLKAFRITSKGTGSSLPMLLLSSSASITTSSLSYKLFKGYSWNSAAATAHSIHLKTSISAAFSFSSACAFSNPLILTGMKDDMKTHDDGTEQDNASRKSKLFGC